MFVLLYPSQQHSNSMSRLPPLARRSPARSYSSSFFALKKTTNSCCFRSSKMRLVQRCFHFCFCFAALSRPNYNVFVVTKAASLSRRVVDLSRKRTAAFLVLLLFLFVFSRSLSFSLSLLFFYDDFDDFSAMMFMCVICDVTRVSVTCRTRDVGKKRERFS